MNDPRGLRDANEKLYALHFAAHMPRTLVTSDRDRIHRFVAELGVAVVKPLDGAGGSGVMVVSKTDRNTRSIVDSITQEGTRLVMVQEYLEAVRAGDKRVLLLDGEILGGHQPRRPRRRRALEHPRRRARRALRGDRTRSAPSSRTWCRAWRAMVSSSWDSTSSAASSPR